MNFESPFSIKLNIFIIFLIFWILQLDARNRKLVSFKALFHFVTGNWEGAAQSSFVETFENDMYPILKDTLPEVITGIVAQMDGAADAIEQTDAEVAKAFRG